MNTCPLCESLHDNKYDIEFKDWQEWYQEELSIKKRICDVCEGYIKRQRSIIKISEKEVKSLVNSKEELKSTLEQHKTNLTLELKHYVDMKFMDIENRIKNVLKLLDDKLK